MEWILILFLTGYGQRSRTSFFNTCIKNNFGFWPINVEISLNTKTGGQQGPWPLRLVFVFKLISTFNSQNPKFFLCMCWRRMFCFSDHSPWKINLKSILFKVVLSWKQCICDVITGKVYCTMAEKGHDCKHSPFFLPDYTRRFFSLQNYTRCFFLQNYTRRFFQGWCNNYTRRFFNAIITRDVFSMQ
jgi:hypothetical protein